MRHSNVWAAFNTVPSAIGGFGLSEVLHVPLKDILLSNGYSNSLAFCHFYMDGGGHSEEPSF